MSFHANTMNAIDLRPYMIGCGYNEARIAENVEIDLGRYIPLLAFAHSPHDSRSSCLAVIDNVTEPEADVARCREVGAPLVFASFNEQWQLWKQATERPQLIESIAPSELTNFFNHNQANLAPDSVYRAKTWARVDKSYQLAFVDLGLMPLIEEEAGQKLSGLIERVVIDSKASLGWDSISYEQGQWLLKSSFWLLAGKILRDKNVSSFAGLELEDLDDVFDRVATHYGAAERVSLGSAIQVEALRESAKEITKVSSLELVTVEALAYLYENALITKATRTELGTHSTPAYLVDYIVGKLRPWIEEIPVYERQAFEPACGHAAFLLASMRLLGDLLPADTLPDDRHDYLRSRLHGCDVDSFALEIARLSLTLSDVPNPNGWDVRRANMFEDDLLAHSSSKANIVLANPPFRVAASVLDLVANNLQPGSMFGVVLPQTLLQSKSNALLRKFIATNFEINEICLFPDKVFTFSDAESAVLIARRRQAGHSAIGKITYRHVREREVDSFKRSFSVANERHTAPSRFSEKNDWSFLIPDLEEVWEFCNGLPRFESIARIGQGFQFRSHDDPAFPDGAVTESHEWEPGLVSAFTRLRDQIQTHQLPDRAWVNLNPEVIGRPRHGLSSGIAQVLLNYARVSRGPWRLKAFLDSKGHPVSSRFLVVRPLNKSWSVEALWGICNSPFANAYSYAFSGRRDVLAGLMRQMPIPNVDSDEHAKLFDAVTAYMLAARHQGGRQDDSTYPSELLKELHWRIDAEVLRLYRLPVSLEHQLLALFTGAQRRGVPFNQTQYFPGNFSEALTLQQFLWITADWDKTNERRVELIRRKIKEAISGKEEVELNSLQKLADSRVRLFAPLPLDEVGEVQETLKRRGMWEGNYD